ncbi:MAG: hypothetical protein CVV18_01295 [Gammaproteobacteria bacterium HGW-Gammaproteobacteria-8]|nr:MAG: hypothetical protein CVV18_01295 [Gammaproteobacteria bacterium HGW-Gammaproteobacteria-8]
MRVTKPQTASLITRPFEFRRTRYCAFSVLAGVPLGDAAAIVSEQSLWNDVGRHLPEGWVLEEGPPKARPEFLVAGSAWVADEAEASACEVSVRLGSASKTLVVTGDRHFIGRTPSEPELFRSMPLTWEAAFGGADFAPNPLGRGFGPAPDSAGRKIHWLPNVEYPARRQRSPTDKVPPACFGPVDIRWPLRAEKAGCYDKRWLEDRYPGFADDIDWGLFNLASADQQLAEPLRGDEAYVLVGLHPTRPEIRGRLPGVQARLFVRADSARALQEPEMTLKTVWFLPEAERAVLVWSGSVEVEQPDASDLHDVVIGFDWSNEHRPAAHFANVLEQRTDSKIGPLVMLDDQPLVPAGCPQIDVVSLGGEGARLQDCPGYANAQRQLSRELEQSGTELSRSMDEIGVDVPPPDPKSLHLLADLERADSVSPDRLPELRARLDEYMEQQRVDLQAFAADSQRELDQALATLNASDGEDRVSASESHAGPPTFSAERERADIRQRIDAGELDDKTRSELRASLCDESMDRMLDFAEASEARAYRMTAHQRKPIRRVDTNRRLRKRLAESLRSGGSLAGADFCGADLSGMDLSGQDLGGIYLEAANLDQTDLTGATFDNAVLAHASLRAARADDARFLSANLGNAVMTELAAAGARFSGAILEGATLYDARLERCAMDGCAIRGLSLQRARLVDCDLTGLVFAKTGLEEAEFRGSRLGDCLFYQQHFDGVCFDGADLAEATFYECRAAGTSFVGASMTNARLVGASDFSGSNFESARLPEAMLGDLRLSHARFDNADLRAANLRGAVLDNASFVRSCCVDAQFVHAVASGADFSGANLMRASLERVDARGASFRSACLFQADLALIHVDTDTDFTDAMTERMRTLPRKFPKEAAI